MSYISEDIKREPRVEPPIHPGEIIATEFLEPMEITPYKLAKDIGVPSQKMYSLVRGGRGISADTALRLGRYFGMSARFFLNLQNRYELETAEDVMGEDLQNIEPVTG